MERHPSQPFLVLQAENAPEPCCLPARGEGACGGPGQEATPCPSPGVTRKAGLLAAGMVKLEGGRFLMGTNGPEAWPTDAEGPAREVTLDPFWLCATAVTNAQFAEFVEETGHVTEAEKFGWSYVFWKLATPRAHEQQKGVAGGVPWWLGVEGANWRCPEGPGSNIRKRLDHPVVHVSWNDAAAFCSWAGGRLPTDAEWEYAARGGLVQKLYPWGDELTPRGKNGKPEHRCNIWQGKFPDYDSGADGFVGTAPVRSYRPNDFGLYQMSGNVWEWCEDWFAIDAPLANPSHNPRGPAHGTHKLTRGGSYLCHASYCNRYRVSAKTANTPDSTTGHTGFRLARSVE